MSLYPDEVIDTRGFRYKLKTPPMSQGGQGWVFLEQEGRYLVKLLKKRSDATRERLRRLHLLPLRDVEVSRIHGLLKEPHVGYVMERLQGMEPILGLIHPLEDEDYLNWYLKTGGIRRRLALLKQLVVVLMQLRNKGLIYGDLSPNNVFVSTDQRECEVFLIDVDNITYESDANARIYTPRYGAPELVRGEACISSRTDSHALGVLIYELLTGRHPLIGDLVDSLAELEDRALKGALPWVDDKKDRSNCATYGLPSSEVFGRSLPGLFEKTFDLEQGLQNPHKRPTLADWWACLDEDLSKLVECPKCRWTYYFRNAVKECPACGEQRPNCFSAKVHLRYVSTEGKGEMGQFHDSESLIIPSMIFQEGIAYYLTSSKLGLASPVDDQQILELKIVSKDRMNAQTTGSMKWWAKKPDGEFMHIFNRETRLNTDYELHCGSKDEPHRFLRFKRHWNDQ